MEAFAAFLRQRRPGRVVVLTGAGISTSAGLADFRSEAGIYARFDEWKARIGVPYPEAVFDLNYFRQDPKPFYAMMRELFGRKAGHVPMPTEAHWFMRLLYEKGILLRNYTQNIDSLEHLAGLPSELVVESHGHFRSASCTGRLSSGFGGLPEDIPACGAEYPPSYVRRFLEKEPWGVPTCARCGGWVKPALTFFGEALPPTFWDAARADFDEAEAMIVMGTSLQVQPFASLIERVPPTCARLMINRDPPKFGPFRRTARRLALWNERSRLGQNPRQVLREDDSDADDDLVHGYDHDGAPKRGHDAFGDLVQQFDFALEEEAEAMGGNAVRDPNRAKLRDAIHLGDADEAVAELCRMLGWEADLARVRAEGEARYERYRAEHGDGGWWSVFEFAASPPDEKADPAGAEKRGTRMGGMAGGANEAWARLQSRFGVETPRECEFM
ncbi:DHS-like NAD/FAD-binding domain-containing protein [Hyaloraphidium curvatum]|nr:DHS-like NAD/FAD-binding domain-containing protein [Hyaloraphidium curvatum]